MRRRSRFRVLGVLAGAGLCLGLFGPAPARADWVQLGGSLNIHPGEDAKRPSLTIQNGMPFVAWQESNTFNSYSSVYVKRYNGSSWDLVGGAPLNHDRAAAAERPSLAASPAQLFVAWQEDNGANWEVRVKYFETGPSWNAIGGPLNVVPADDATNAVMALSSSYPYVAWQEAGGVSRIYVKHFDGGVWEADGTSVNGASGAHFPKLAIGNDEPLVSRIEDQNCRVARYNGLSWLDVDGVVDRVASSNSGAGDLVFAFGDPVCTWFEMDGTFQIYVSRFNGSGWEPLGVSQNHTAGANAYNPKLAHDDVRLYLTWYEAGDVYVKRLTATGWEYLGTNPLDVDPARDASTPDIAAAGDGNVIVAWIEDFGLNTHLRVKRWVPPATPTPTATPVLTASPTPTATPTPADPVPEHVRTDEIIAYPIPARDRVTFAVRASQGRGEVVVRVFNTRYRLVTHLAGEAPGGEAVLHWDVRDVAPGVYYAHARVGEQSLTVTKLVVVK